MSNEEETIGIDLPILAPFQQEWIKAQREHKFVAVEGATMTGKTYVHEPQLFAEAHQPVDRGDEYWWVAPTIAQARAVYSNIKRSIEDANAQADYRCIDNLREIHTPGGGILCYKTGEDPDNIFGTRNVRRVIVDEFTRCRMSLWPALYTVSNKTGCHITFIGNYTGDDTEWHLWIKKMQGSPRFKYFRTTAQEAVDAGIMPKADYDAAREELTHGEFNALYLCQGSADPSLLVKYEAVADLWHNTHVLDGLPALTCDIAMHGSDRFTILAWKGLVLHEITSMTKRDAPEIEAIIKGKALEHGVGRSRIVYDADGMGAFLRGYLQGASPYQGGASMVPQMGQKMAYQNLRSQCHYLAADAINSRKMWISTSAYRDELEPEILACLRTSGQDASLRYGIVPKDTQGKKIRDLNGDVVLGAKQRLGRSPDLFDPIPMRMFLELAPSPVMVDSLHEAAQKKRIKFAASKRTDTRHTPFTGR